MIFSTGSRTSTSPAIRNHFSGSPGLRIKRPLQAGIVGFAQSHATGRLAASSDTRAACPILAPVAQNNLSTLLFRGTFANRVQGQPLFLKDLNCHCIDPNKDFVLNPAAWSDPASGQFGTAAAYYNDYRYQRRPAESANFGRAFRIRESMSFEIRGEFFNVFNRTQINTPDSTNALATPTRNSAGVPASGFGRINAGSLYSNPRSGQLLARFRF